MRSSVPMLYWTSLTKCCQAAMDSEDVRSGWLAGLLNKNMLILERLSIKLWSKLTINFLKLSTHSFEWNHVGGTKLASLFKKKTVIFVLAVSSIKEMSSVPNYCPWKQTVVLHTDNYSTALLYLIHFTSLY